MALFKMFEVQKRGSLKKAVESEDKVLGKEKLAYEKGKAYYELKKDETIQDYKTIVILKKEDNSFIWGEKVRDVLKIPDITPGSKQKFKPDMSDIAEEFRVFVQSTSHNRIVEPKTHILYQLVDVLPADNFFVDCSISEEEGVGKGHKRSSENDNMTSKDITVVPKKQKIVGAVDDGEKKIEVAFSFDTTGSMYACLGEVRRQLKETINRLHSDIPGIRIAVIAHGDYCDKVTSYVIKHIDFTENKNSLCNFVQNVGSTGGGDADECYELVLRTAHSELSWSPQAEKSLVVIGDANPHGIKYPLNDLKLDWKKECETLKEKSIRIYAVQALDRSESTAFYRTMAEKTAGFHIKLDQFSSIVDFMLAICYHESGATHLQAFETEVRGRGRGMNRELHCMFDLLAGRSTEFHPSGGMAASVENELTPISPSRFQDMHVDDKCSIKSFVLENSLLFKVGRGFYEFTKPEKISDKKEVVLINKATGDMYTGPEACRMIGAGGSGKVQPASLDTYRVFVQSTSYNRVLMPDTGFLYEVDTEH